VRNQLRFGNQGYRVDLIDKHPLHVQIHVNDETHDIRLAGKITPGAGRIVIDGRYLPYFVTQTPAAVWVTLDGVTRCFERRRERGQTEEASGGFTAPMPGKVIAVEVAEGDHVEKGHVLVIMEAMKMEHRIEAPGPGVVSALHCGEGELVGQGKVLLELTPD